MSLTTTPVLRVFLYNGRELADPDPSIPPEQVKQFYANIHPDLVNALVEEQAWEGTRQCFEFRRAIGTKG
jgi:PRTRC genetic system protein C